MIIIINILAPYEAIQSFWEKKLKHGKIKTFLKKVVWWKQWMRMNTGEVQKIDGKLRV